MEENFSIQRLQALLLRFWVEKKGSLILPFIIVVLVFLLLNFISTAEVVSKGGFATIIITLFSKWIFLAFMVYHLHLAFAKGSGSVKFQLLHLLPASAAEKFVYFTLISLVLPLVVYFCVFQLMNGICMMTMHASSIPFHKILFAEIEMIGYKAGMYKITLMLKLFSLLSFYLTYHLLVWGQIVFKDYAVLKVFGIFYLAYSILGFVVFQLFNAKFWLDFIATAKRYATDSPEYYTQLSWSMFVLFFALMSGLLYVNYMQFKRKEIKV